jgi:hypothetical protein
VHESACTAGLYDRRAAMISRSMRWSELRSEPYLPPAYIAWIWVAVSARL